MNVNRIRCLHLNNINNEQFLWNLKTLIRLNEKNYTNFKQNLYNIV